VPDALARLSDLSAPAWLVASVLVVSVWAWIFPPIRQRLILNPYRVLHHGEVHRLLTAGWLHADLTHLVFNVFTLYFFAGYAVRALGPTRLVALYVSAVVASYIPTTLRHMRDPTYNSLGASGAVAAVMFSAILLYPKLKLTLMFLPVAVPGPLFALAYLAYSMWHSRGAGDHVNHDAHFAGAVYGALLTYVFEPARVERAIRSMF